MYFKSINEALSQESTTENQITYPFEPGYIELESSYEYHEKYYSYERF